MCLLAGYHPAEAQLMYNRTDVLTNSDVLTNQRTRPPSPSILPICVSAWPANTSMPHLAHTEPCPTYPHASPGLPPPSALCQPQRRQHWGRAAATAWSCSAETPAGAARAACAIRLAYGVRQLTSGIGGVHYCTVFAWKLGIKQDRHPCLPVGSSGHGRTSKDGTQIALTTESLKTNRTSNGNTDFPPAGRLGRMPPASPRSPQCAQHQALCSGSTPHWLLGQVPAWRLGLPVTAQALKGEGEACGKEG